MVEAVALVPSEGVSLADIDEILTTRLGLRRQGSGRIGRTFFDTFDGRLARAGLVAEHEWLEGLHWLRVRRIGGTTALAQAVCERVTGPVTALADRRLRAVLEGPCGGRALIATIHNDGELLRYAELDELDKTTVRVTVVASEATAGATASSSSMRHVLDPVVTVAPVRGHERRFAAACEAVALHIGQREAVDPLRRAAAACGVVLGADPSDRAVVLEASEPAVDAVRRVLQRAADVVAANVGGVIARTDAEFLHDLRVTLRATRAVVGATHGVLDERTRDELAGRLRDLMALTSPVRDLDVLRAAWVDDEVLARLDPVLAADHAGAHAALVAALRHPTFDELLAALRDAPAATGASSATTAAWAAASLSKELRRLHRLARRSEAELVAAGGYVTEDEDSPLHRTRKQAKRVRYLLETFDPLDADGRLARLRKALKGVQEELGAYQDGRAATATLVRAATRLEPVDRSLLIELGRRSAALQADGRAAAARFPAAYAPVAKQRHRAVERLDELAARHRVPAAP